MKNLPLIPLILLLSLAGSAAAIAAPVYDTFGVNRAQPIAIGEPVYMAAYTTQCAGCHETSYVSYIYQGIEGNNLILEVFQGDVRSDKQLQMSGQGSKILKYPLNNQLRALGRISVGNCLLLVVDKENRIAVHCNNGGRIQTSRNPLDISYNRIIELSLFHSGICECAYQKKYAGYLAEIGLEVPPEKKVESIIYQLVGYNDREISVDVVSRYTNGLIDHDSPSRPVSLPRNDQGYAILKTMDDKMLYLMPVSDVNVWHPKLVVADTSDEFVRFLQDNARLENNIMPSVPEQAATQPVPDVRETPDAGISNLGFGPVAYKSADFNDTLRLKRPASHIFDNTVNVIDTPTYGKVLADYEGRPLYTYAKDEPGISRCQGACLGPWRPFLISYRQEVTKQNGIPGTVGVIERMTDRDPLQVVDWQKHQVTYNGKPLYQNYQNEPGRLVVKEVDGLWFLVKFDDSIPVRKMRNPFVEHRLFVFEIDNAQVSDEEISFKGKGRAIFNDKGVYLLGDYKDDWQDMQSIVKLDDSPASEFCKRAIKVGQIPEGQLLRLVGKGPRVFGTGGYFRKGLDIESLSECELIDEEAIDKGARRKDRTD